MFEHWHIAPFIKRNGNYRGRALPGAFLPKPTPRSIEEPFSPEHCRGDCLSSLAATGFQDRLRYFIVLPGNCSYCRDKDEFTKNGLNFQTCKEFNRSGQTSGYLLEVYVLFVWIPQWMNMLYKFIGHFDLKMKVINSWVYVWRWAVLVFEKFLSVLRRIFLNWSYSDCERLRGSI